jgi:DNA-binding GntR family transcriptional regulator
LKNTAVQSVYVLERESKVHTNLSDIAYNTLRNEILRCELASGSQLVESHIAKRYGISRTPVREALKRLLQDGLVEVSLRRGYSVMPVTVRDVQEVFNLRIILEGEAAALATPKISDRLLDDLDKLLSDTLRMEENTLEDDTKRMAYISANTRFHRSVAEASGNQRLASIVSHLLDEAVRFIYLETGVVGESGIEESRVIVNAMRAKEAERARQSMINHIHATYERTLHAIFMETGAANITLSPGPSTKIDTLELPKPSLKSLRDT